MMPAPESEMTDEEVAREVLEPWGVTHPSYENLFDRIEQAIRSVRAAAHAQGKEEGRSEGLEEAAQTVEHFDGKIGSYAMLNAIAMRIRSRIKDHEDGRT